MGRGHLIRALAAAAVAVAALAAGATAGISWHEIVVGSTTQTSTNVPHAYLALTKAQERVWASRLSAHDRAIVARTKLANTALVAAFLDGAPCSTHIVASAVTRQSRTLVVSVSYTRPAPGVALCIRVSTPYVVVGVSRASLGGVTPNRASLVLHARG